MTGLEGPALGAAVKAALALAREWTRTKDFDRLCEALSRRFEDRGAFSSAFFADLAEDEAFLLALSSYFSPPHLFDRGALVAALTPLVGPLDEDSSAEDFAAEIADAIREEIRTAKTGDALVRYEVDRVIETVGTPVVEPALGWAPERARAQLERSAREDPQGIGQLAKALAGKDQRTELVGLVRHPQPWLATGGPPLWESVATLCEILGCPDEAQSAWGTYESLPGADRVRGLLGSAAAAGLRGETETEAALLARARELDPSHDRVRLAAAARIEDPVGRREALEGLKFELPDIEADRLAALALTLDDLGLIEEARPLTAEALELAPVRLGPREAVAATILADHIRRFETAQAPDRAALRVAAGHYGYLREALRESGRRLEAGGVAGRLIQCELLADRRDEARRLLVEVEEEELQGEVPVDLAGLALALGELELIEPFLDHYEGASPRADLLRSRLALRDPARRLQAVADLDALLGGEEAFEAAVIRLSAAVPSTGEVPWSEEAERVVAAEQPVLASHLKAEWHSARGDGDAARREFARRVGDPRAESWLMMYLADRKEWAKAAPHAEALLRSDPDNADRIAAGQVLRHAGRQAAAEAAFGAVAKDPESSAREFAAAVEELGDLLIRAGRLSEAIALGEDAGSRAPSIGGWLRGHALALDGRTDQAIHAVKGLAPRGAHDRSLLVALIVREEPPTVALRRLIAVADELEEPDEEIEMQITLALLKCGEDDLDADLIARGGPARFAELFPDSKRMWREEIPEDKALLLERLEELGGNRALAVDEARRRVFEEGDWPMGALAAAIGRTLAETWALLTELPIDYEEDADDASEAAAAEAAAGGPVVLDTAALRVLEVIDGDLLDRILAEFPHSRKAFSVIDDLLRSTSGLDALAGEGGAMARIVEAMLSVARRLDTAPLVPAEDADPDDGSQIAAIYRETQAIGTQSRIAVYSDDRVFRSALRDAGIPTFGTVALLAQLVDSGAIAEAEGERARAALRAARGEMQDDGDVG